MGFFGYAYFLENAQRLKLVAIDGGNGCVEPNADSIAGNTYTPLSRPLFTYFNAARLERNRTLRAFAEFTFAPEARPLIADTGYLAYPPDVYEAARDRLDAGVTGSAFVSFTPGDSVLDAVRSAGDE